VPVLIFLVEFLGMKHNRKESGDIKEEESARKNETGNNGPAKPFPHGIRESDGDESDDGGEGS
jgi:hypothetical protein